MTLNTSTIEAVKLPFETERETFSENKPLGEEASGFLTFSVLGKQLSVHRAEPLMEQRSTTSHSVKAQETLEEEKEKALPSIPQLEGLDVQDPILTSKVRSLIDSFWAIVISKALQTHFPVSRANISIISDPSEGRRQVALRIFTETNAGQAIAFWDSLERDLHEWLDELLYHENEIFLRALSLRIHWQ